MAGETEPLPDPVLVRTLAEARAWATSLRAGTTLAEIAASTGRSEPYIRTRIPLAFLAPRLQAAILDGRQPPDLSVAGLLREGIPMGWDDQARLFGAHLNRRGRASPGPALARNDRSLFVRIPSLFG